MATASVTYEASCVAARHSGLIDEATGTCCTMYVCSTISGASYRPSITLLGLSTSCHWGSLRVTEGCHWGVAVFVMMVANLCRLTHAPAGILLAAIR